MTLTSSTPATEFKADYIAADGTPVQWVGHCWMTPNGDGTVTLHYYNGGTFSGGVDEAIRRGMANQPANDLTQWR